MAQLLPDSIPVVSVADLSRRLKRTVESQTGREWVEGEILSFKRAGSGHVYFSLKDTREDACIECVMYRLDALRVRQHLFDGACVQTLGRATLWAPRGRLQFIVQNLRPVGRGAVLEQLERLKAQLRAEGLFEAERKRPLPVAPSVVGIITSAHGAALHDIRSVAFRRGPVLLVLVPALVQGDQAPDSLIQALDRIERDRRVQVVIIGRGGGASEDLMAFNDERVVRRVATLRVPTVSAVGHEVDTTLTDLVADVRAATPSQAAELVVPEHRERLARVLGLRRQVTRAMRARWLEDASLARSLRARLSDPRFVIAQHQQGLDEQWRRAERAIGRRLARSNARVETLERRLLARHPRVLVLGSRSRWEPLTARLRVALERHLERQRHALGRVPEQLRSSVLANVRREQSRLEALRGRLLALSPLTVLRRGYSIVTTESGRVLTSSAAVAPGDALRVRLAEGRLSARVEGQDQDP